MRKMMFVLVLAAWAAGSAAAIELAAGGGLNFFGDFDHFRYKGFGTSYRITAGTIGVGFWGFFDAQYAEADIGIKFGGYRMRASNNYSGYYDYDYATVLSYLTLAAFGKYPFQIGERVRISPMLGVQYDIAIGGLYGLGYYGWYYGSSYSRGYWYNQFWIKAGASADIFIGRRRRMFLRPSVMYGINFGSRGDREMKRSSNFGMFNHGFDFRMAFGTRIGKGSSGTAKSSDTARSSSSGTRYMLVNTDSMNVRKGPSTDYEVVGQVTRNTRVQILESSGQWWKIRAGNVEGFVNSTYLVEEK